MSGQSCFYWSEECMSGHCCLIWSGSRRVVNTAYTGVGAGIVEVDISVKLEWE